MPTVMDSKLYENAITELVCSRHRTDSFNFQQKTIVKENNALHLATKFNRIDLVKKIVSESNPQLMAQLMYQQNHKGDTPLHIASRYGHFKMIELLTNHAKNGTTESIDLEAEGAAAAPKNMIFVLVNDKKDTALHDAVRNGHFKVVEILISKDLESTKLCNDDGDSPLYLAYDRKKFDIATYIINKSPECSCRGRGGRNVLHAIAIRTSPVPHSEGLLELWIRYSKHPTSFMYDFLKESKAIWLTNKDRIRTALKIIYILLSIPIHLLFTIVCLLLFVVSLLVGVVCLLVSVVCLIVDVLVNVVCKKMKKMFSPEDPNTNKEVEVAEGDLGKTCESWCISWFNSLLECLPDSLKEEETTKDAVVQKSVIEKFKLLVKESDDEFQWTPLHYAAYLGNKKAVKAMLELDETKTVVYEKDRQGMSALHIAAKEGHVEIINHIIERYPATCELLDVKGRTILHVAVENGRYNVVKYILQTPGLEDLLNEQDCEDGNTLLHYAAIHGHGSILKLLVDDERVDKGVFNYRGLLAHTFVSDMELRHFQKARISNKMYKMGGPPTLEARESLQTEDVGSSSSSSGDVVPKEDQKCRDIKAHISNKMYKMGGPPTLKARESSQTEDVETRKLGQLENNVIGRKNSSSGDVVPKEDRKYRDIKEVGKNNILVITIMATVTFAVGFQIPGGIDNGHSVSAQNGKLKCFFAAFQIANTLGFCSSLAAISTHFSASTEKECGVYRHFMRFASLLTYISIWSTGVSYIMGTHLVITQHPLLAAVNLAIFGCSVFLTMLVWLMR